MGCLADSVAVEGIGAVALFPGLTGARGVSALILKLMGRGVIVFSAGIIIFVVESVVTGSAIGQSLLGSGKGVGQSGPFTVGNRPCDCCSGDYRILCEFGGLRQRKKGDFLKSGGLMR